jgi:hypothetical protein
MDLICCVAAGEAIPDVGLLDLSTAWWREGVCIGL